jgi:hypothetical protein
LSANIVVFQFFLFAGWFLRSGASAEIEKPALGSSYNNSAVAAISNRKPL